METVCRLTGLSAVDSVDDEVAVLSNEWPHTSIRHLKRSPLHHPNVTIPTLVCPVAQPRHCTTTRTHNNTDDAVRENAN